MKPRFQVQRWVEPLDSGWVVTLETDSDIEAGREASRQIEEFKNWETFTDEDVRIFDRKLNIVWGEIIF